MKVPFISLLLSAAVSADRTSTNYTITTDTLDFGGQRVTSSNYAIHGSVGTVAGVSENSSGAVTLARHGYVGQIYDLLGYGLLASDFYPPEEGSTQIIPVRTADDGTNLIIPTTGFTFTPLEGPISSISSTGLLETSSVHEDTQIMVGATSPAFAGELQLLLYVLDTLPDNFGTYAGDGLPDTWQIDYFGHDNPLAAPLLDPDGDGQNNQFEYTAGIIPTDPLSRFLLSIEPVPGEPTHRNLKFSPVFGDRTYTVKSNTTLGGGVWENLTDFADDNNNPERTVTDQAATPSKKFYQVEITKP
ncbi:MAG: hypothetical protein MUF13_15665 [Akkermansiaceae bacterium]|jgi:hypothetical protein|nr:hypothetical protein [Akkermansiaceae bacterium]